jgi:hypothetical protein
MVKHYGKVRVILKMKPSRWIDYLNEQFLISQGSLTEANAKQFA